VFNNLCEIPAGKLLVGNFELHFASSCDSRNRCVCFGFCELSFEVRNNLWFYEEVWFCDGNIFRGILDLCMNKLDPCDWVLFYL